MSEKIQKVEVVGTSETCLTFTIHGEGHTLGNALRYAIVKNPDVEFCGYSIPHPSDDIVNIRVQTLKNVRAVDAFRKGLRDLAEMTDAIREEFVCVNDNAMSL